MDFENVNDKPLSAEPTFPVSEDPFSKPEDTGPISRMAAAQPETTTPASLFGGASKKTLSMLVISMFITLIIGSIGAYVVITTIRASEPKEDPYLRYKNLPVPSKKPTTAPTAIAPVVLATPEAIPTAASEEAEVVPEETKWSVVLDEPLLSVAALETKNSATISATLFGPIELGATVCIEKNRNTHQYFTQKKAGQLYEKICQEVIDSKAPRFTCTPYDPATGVVLDEPLLPKKLCQEPGSSISKGTYVIYSKIFYNCDVMGKALKNITESDCTDSYEITSEELTVED
jgi:hypothetical protein